MPFCFQQNNLASSTGGTPTPSHSGASKLAKQAKKSYERYQKIAAMSSSKVVPNGEKADVMDALTRYYAATNVAMLLPKEPELIKEAITDFCAVTDEKKSELRAHWQHAVSNGRALCACALCGQRDLSSLYEQMHVAGLPSFFELDAASLRELDVLKSGVRLMSASGVLQDELTDLSAIMSSYLSTENGKRYHVHPELVGRKEEIDVCCACLKLVAFESEPVTDGDELESKRRTKRRTQLANACLAIAAGHDYGVSSRVARDTPSLLEGILLSENRNYAVIIKVSASSAKTMQGDCIVFPQDGPAEGLKLLSNIGESVKERVKWVRDGGLLRVVLVGSRGEHEKWIQDNILVSVLVVRPHVIFNELRIRRKIDDALNPNEEKCAPGPVDATYEEDFVEPLENLSEHFISSARRLGTEAEIIDEIAQAKASDVAGVRDSTAEGLMSSEDVAGAGHSTVEGLMSSVGLMSSSEELPKDADGSMFLSAVQNMLACDPSMPVEQSMRSEGVVDNPSDGGVKSSAAKTAKGWSTFRSIALSFKSS